MTRGAPGAGGSGGGRRRAAAAPKGATARSQPSSRARSGDGRGQGGQARRQRELTPGAAHAPRATERRHGRSETPELGGEQVEGRHAVRALLAARRRPVREVWLADGLDPAPILDDIAALAATASVPVRTVNNVRLRQVATTEAPQGVLAFAAPLPEADLDDLAIDRPGGRAPFLVVVDGLTDPHNLGALLRTAQCAGATGAVLPRHRSAHVTATVAKAAAGAIEYLPMAVVPGIASALARLAGAGVWTVGLDAAAPTPLWSLAVATEPIALVLGAEGAGLSRLAKTRCQLLVSIPQAGPIASLNVAAAGALACFEVSRARPEG
ncbi:MAG: rRNA (guanosine2251-2-O)-methyltransferase [Acidimicrobiaceae bacterium]|nr:rRNA (guanosine2251-2-O)-methyltransferase [Acidimicrobiaceae bacterium]